MTDKTILVVESELKLREKLRQQIEAWSFDRYKVKAVRDGQEALGFLQSWEVQLLITDHIWPELKQLPNKPTIIIVSNYSDFQYVQEAIQLGVVNYLLKPLSHQSLINALEQTFVQDKTLTKILTDNQLTKINMNGSQPIPKAIHYINAHYKDTPTLQEVADFVHLSPSYFSVLFREETCITFREYLIRKKIQEAKRLLLETSLSIEEVTSMVGYQSSKYFIRLFKHYEGLTPAKYRKHINSLIQKKATFS